MKCQQCSKPAMVHLTEIVAEGTGVKRAVEIHLCLTHATEAGLVAAGAEMITGSPGSGQAGESAFAAAPLALIPEKTAGGLALRKDSSAMETDACPTCGLTWASFKSGGVMGCPHDYAFFQARLEPLLRRAQEGATGHMGKVPAKQKSEASEREAAGLRLRKELQKALHAERYEEAAALRDKLRRLGVE